MNEEKSWAINDKVDCLLQVGFIWETFYPDWLSNPVLVKKKNGKWRVCIDFINLNESCSKDSYPLPSNQLVEATTGHELLRFMDTYSGYNQIKMHPPDKDKIAFTTGWGIYCYKVMPDSRMLGPHSSEWLTMSSRIWSGAPWRYTSMIYWWRVYNTRITSNI